MGSIGSRLLLLASAVCIVAGLVGVYARAAILDPDPFADRAVAALAQDEVADEIASRFTDGVLERSPGLVTLRPALDSAAGEVVASPWFAARFGAGVRRLHGGIFEAGDPRPALRVPGMAAQVQAAVAQRTPVLALRLPRDADPALMSIGGSTREQALLRAAETAGGTTALAPVALVLGLLGLVAAALAAPDRRRGTWASGIALAGAGGSVVLAWLGARTLTLEGFDTGWGDAVVRSIWGAYLGDLRAWSVGLALAGIVVAAAAARPGPVRWSEGPRALRGGGLLAAGALVLADRDLALDLAAACAGGVLLYLGARHALAGPGRVTLAGAALLAVAVGVAAAASGPPAAPDAVAAAQAAPKPAGSGAGNGGGAAAGKRGGSRAADGGGSAGGERGGSVAAHGGGSGGAPRICFASVQDARAAAEGAAIPEGARVRLLSDGRVCVRAG